ncbi:uncharacterized protein LOC132881491 isoform X1 [Neoarius graeffei]|uniref:uncharacterized protein LOC132881491 isoform X1 n=3 Tax=Neoarius graeffei TaxID=443677 RepID=UPI00298C9047|nr:uncharacterized protein LOC132881491 isoform X1 [Neoarius graeffei]XP_060769977.1 uncharacterized protein LOC132881491 isoform X1 [Neoarius graeffei]
MSTPAKLRVIFDDHTVHKLVLPSGIPGTLQDLKLVIQSTFCTPDGFTLMYQDEEFGGQFFTLTSIEDVQDKGTLKVVQVEPVILDLSAVEEKDDNVTESDSMSSISLASQDTVLFSSSDESPSHRSQPWPRKFEIPLFSFGIRLLLEAGNQAYHSEGTLLNNPKVTSGVLEELAEKIFEYTAYPTGIQVLNVVEALIEKYPCLKEPGSFNGMYGWQQRIKYKMGNYRAKVRGLKIACPELEVNKKTTSSPKGIRRPKKAEVNYLPPLPLGQTKETMDEERVDLLTEVKKTNNDKIISEKMEKTFPYRRLEVVSQMPAVPDVMERWPALFSQSQVKEEFKRITTIQLDRTFLSKMDLYTPKLLTVFKTKGGTAGTKIKSVLESLSQKQIDSHDAVIRCLIPFLGESTEELIKDYQQDVSKDVIEQDLKDNVIKILVLGSAAEGAPPTDVIIVIDGTEVLGGCKTLANACMLLMGFVYSLNLSYPPKLKYTFEVFQKLLLELDDLKVSPKVDSLRRKLLH